MSSQPPVYLDDEGNEIDPNMQHALEAQRQAFNDPMAQGEGFLGETGPATAAGVLAAVSPVRAAGAAYGAFKGYQGGGKVAGLPGALAGGLGGGIAGAISPVFGATGAGALSDMAQGNVKGAAFNALANLLLGRFGGAGKAGRAAKGAENIAQEVQGARTVAAARRAVPASAAPKAKYEQAIEAARKAEPRIGPDGGLVRGPGPAAAVGAPRATEVAPGFDTTQLMQLKAAWSNPNNRAQIREWVAAQAPEVQKQVKQFLLGNAMR